MAKKKTKYKKLSDFTTEATNQYLKQLTDAQAAALAAKNTANANYNASKNAVTASYDTSKATASAARNSSVDSVNSSYDNALTNLKKQYVQTKNNFDNTTLERGIGRSSIFSSGMAGLDNAQATDELETNKERNAKISEYDTAYTNAVNSADTSYRNELSKYSTDLSNAVSAADASVTGVVNNKTAIIEALKNTLYQNYLNTEIAKKSLTASSSSGGGSGRSRVKSSGVNLDEVNAVINNATKLDAQVRNYSGFSPELNKKVSAARNNAKDYYRYLSPYKNNKTVKSILSRLEKFI